MGESCYAMNRSIAGMTLSTLPPDTVLFFETDSGHTQGPGGAPDTSRSYDEPDKVDNETAQVRKDRFNQMGGPEDMILCHEKHGKIGCNVVFVDGTTVFVTEDDVQSLRWIPE
jgi:hypothetical protein